MNIYSIYCITNTINNKKYIGFTSKNPPEKRWEVHLAKCSSAKKQAIHNAIVKHGKENFTFEVIYQSTERDHTLNEMETYFINLYDTFGENGYNMRMGGLSSLGYKPTEETKKKMSISAKLKPAQSEETRNKYRAAGLKGSAAYNKRYTPEVRDRLSRVMKDRMSKGHKPRGNPTWTVKKSSGEIVSIKNPTTWCEENNIPFSVLWSSYNSNRDVTKGKLKGWRLLCIEK